MLDLLIIPGASPGLIRISIEENRSYRILITRPIPRTPNSIILWDSLLIYSYWFFLLLKIGFIKNINDAQNDKIYELTGQQ